MAILQIGHSSSCIISLASWTILTRSVPFQHCHNLLLFKNSSGKAGPALHGLLAMVANADQCLLLSAMHRLEAQF